MNGGNTAYMLTMPKDVPVDGFWSVSVDNKDGFSAPIKLDAYSKNNVTEKKIPGGGMTVHFVGDPKADIYLLIAEGWNDVVRLCLLATGIANSKVSALLRIARRR